MIDDLTKTDIRKFWDDVQAAGTEDDDWRDIGKGIDVIREEPYNPDNVPDDYAGYDCNIWYDKKIGWSVSLYPTYKGNDGFIHTDVDNWVDANFVVGLPPRTEGQAF